MTCRHLLAPLQADESDPALQVFRNWRKCASCGEPLWDDGSPMAYLGTGDEAAPPPSDRREEVPSPLNPPSPSTPGDPA
jgi:hypothetical protein